MAGSSTQYGPYNPNAVDPFPIESVLAKEASTSPADAWNMLQAYRSSNQAQGREYAVAAGQQHDFAKQQLVATMADNMAKNAQGFLKEPGGLQFANANPNFNYLTAGTDPGVLGGIMQQQTRLQNADILSKSGGGINSMTQAGFQPSGEQATEATGITGLVPNDPVSIQAAKIRAAATKAAAAMHSKAEVLPTINVAANPIPGLGSPSVAFPGKGNIHDVPGMFKFMTDAGLATSLPPSATPPSPDAQPKGKTSLTVAKTEGAGGTGPGGDIQALAKRELETKVRTQDPAAYKDIMAGAKGGRIQIKQMPDGVAMIGASGKPY